MTLTKNRADSDVHVDQVDSSVPLRVQHLVKGKDVVLNSVLLQVVVLDGGYSQDLSCCFNLILCDLHQSLPLLSQSVLEHLLCTCLCLVQEFQELDTLAFTGLYLSDLLLRVTLLLRISLLLAFACVNLLFFFWLFFLLLLFLFFFLFLFLVFSLGLFLDFFLRDIWFLEDQAKAHVVNLGDCGVIVATDLGTLKDQLEVELLANVSDVDYLISLLLMDSVSNCSQISSVIVEPTIRLLDHQGYFLLGNEYALSTLVLLEYASGS